MRQLLSFTFVILLALLQMACTSGARMDHMVVKAPTGVAIPQNFVLRDAVALGNVTGGKETNPLLNSKVGNNELRSALHQSLQTYSILNESAPRYRLDVQLVSLDQPFVGFNMEVAAATHIVLTEIATGSTKISEDIKSSYTANFSDHLIGAERLRLANEGAIQSNIQKILERLQTYQ